jgi:hypothetical protein
MQISVSLEKEFAIAWRLWQVDTFPTRQCSSTKCMHFSVKCITHDRLCGLVVRVLGYRSGGPGSIPGTTDFLKEKKKGNQ